MLTRFYRLLPKALIWLPVPFTMLFAAQTTGQRATLDSGVVARLYGEIL